MQYYIRLIFIFIIPLFINTTIKAKAFETTDSIPNKKNVDAINRNIQIIESNRSYENDSILKLALETLDLSANIQYAKGMSLCYKNIGNFFSNKNMNDSAVYYYEKGLNIAKLEDLYEMQSIFYWSLANLYRVTGNYGIALEYSLSCKELVENNKTDRYQYQIYNLLALSYQTLMEYELALQNYQRSAGMAMEEGNESYAGVIYSNIGKLYY
ncbi:MAG: hypothetical protein C0597_17425, partial [Marinilabiliales bacterium]